MKTRALLPALAAWAAALLAIWLPGWPFAPALWTAAVLALVAAIVLGRRGSGNPHGGWLPLVALCLSAAALVSTAAAVQAPQRQPVTLLAAAEGGRPVTLSGMVLSMPQAQSSAFGFGDATRVRFALRVESAQESRAGPISRLAVPVRAFAEPPAGTAALEIGTRVSLTARLVLNGTGEPDAFRAYGTGPLTLDATPPWYLAWAAELRAEFREAAARLPGEGSRLLPGLAIGDTSAVDEDLDQAMKTSSLSHLTAVSGANCVVVVAAIMLLGAALRLRRAARVALALLVLLAFTVLVTPEPSVLRAGLMALIVLIGLASGRPGGGVPALGLATLVLLALDPWLASSFGFALSASATAGLLLLTAPLATALGRWMPRTLALALALPLAAQLACQPVLILLTPTVSLLGVPANLLAGPAAPAATLLGLIGCLLLPWLPSLGFAVIQIAWLPAAWIAGVAHTVAGLPGARTPWLDGLLGALLLAGASALALWLLLRGSGRRRRMRTVPATLAAAALVAGVGAYGGALLGTGVVRDWSRPADWQIALCDVGQGDAVLLRDGGQTALIDTGPEPAPLGACLDSLGIDRIDLLVLTHYDLDHVGGLDALTGMVDTALVGPSSGPRDERLLAPLQQDGVPMRVAIRGQHGTLGKLEWRVLWPATDDGPLSTGNPGSVVLAVEGAGIRSLFLGDLGAESEAALQRLEPLGRVDVVKVAHHGSSDQDPALYRTLTARVGLIGVGADNGYGHPTSALLEMLEGSGTRAFRSDLHGLVLVAPRPAGGVDALRVWSARRGD
ncbi:ComEC/Rec2 family competence protein [Microterricola viridarii]|uniref:Competence protein ComEC n=1 Tax=Microterricola viridarii TaxID=412690 RepID=A0A1H1VRW5_9MICO|nr:ComEC/Rec2 family competence protein [Microterricola viridarii]SDS87654.1 competence protein ComEC [Microterricola viridarii]